MDNFLEFVSEIMDVDVAELSKDTEYKVFPKWDSLIMLTLIMEIEEEYGVQIPLEKVAAVKTLQNLYDFTQE